MDIYTPFTLLVPTICDRNVLFGTPTAKKKKKMNLSQISPLCFNPVPVPATPKPPNILLYNKSDKKTLLFLFSAKL